MYHVVKDPLANLILFPVSAETFHFSSFARSSVSAVTDALENKTDIASYLINASFMMSHPKGKGCKNICDKKFIN